MKVGYTRIISMGNSRPKIKHYGRKAGYKLTDAQKIARSMQVKQQWSIRIAKRQATGVT